MQVLVGEWSEIGIDPQIDAGTLEAAWKMALGALQALAAELKSDIVEFYNFNQHGKLPGSMQKVQPGAMSVFRPTADYF